MVRSIPIGDTPLHKPHVPPHHAGFLCHFGPKTGLHFAHFVPESGMVFNGTMLKLQCMNVFIVSNPNE